MDGMFNMITCPSGLVFNPKTGICTWPDEAHKLGCSSEGTRIAHIFIYNIYYFILTIGFGAGNMHKNTLFTYN